MQSLSILIAQADGRVGEQLAANLRTHFRQIRVVRGLQELREKLLQDEDFYAVIVDLELVNFENLREICEQCQDTAVVCTHRVANDEMWVEALAAGATDCCFSGDIVGILRAASSTRLQRLTDRAA